MADKDMNLFKEVTKKPYIDQAKFYLNAFWKESQDELENIWKYAQKFIELDLQKKKEGCDLDEFNAHRFLEQVGETKRVVELRETLKAIDLDFNKRMALVEYLLFRYKQTIKELVTRPQGGDEKVQQQIKEAQSKLEQVQTALADLQTKLAAQQKAEEAVKKAEAEQRAAVAELKQQEETYQNTINTLETKSKDTNIGVVQRNKAAAELAQVKSEDPLPLRKAKISSEAALRKVEKERKAAEEATLQVEASVRDMEAKVKETNDYLDELKKKGGIPYGSVWWMEREIKEAQKYLPKSKQKN